MKKKIIHTLLAIAVLAMTSTLAFGLVYFKEDPNVNNQQRDILHVKVQEVTYESQDATAKYRGRIYSADEIPLSAEVSGRILAGDVPLKEGQAFRKGDVLVRIYSDDVQASLRSARSGYLQLLSQYLPDISIDYPDQYEKWSTFFNEIDINRELPPLPEIETEQERVFLASRNLLSQYYTIQQQEINFKKYTIEAPFNGSYQTVTKQVGAVTGMNAEIATLIRTDYMEATIPVMPKDVEWLETGMTLKLARENGESVTGTITRIADFIDSSTQSVNIYVNIYRDNALGIRAGEYVEAHFTRQDLYEGFKLPREALLDNNQVYLLKEGKLQRENVIVHQKMDDFVVINGLPEGAQIVTESLLDVTDNQEVEPI